jgi:hypothetical protein
MTILSFIMHLMNLSVPKYIRHDFSVCVFQCVTASLIWSRPKYFFHCRFTKLGLYGSKGLLFLITQKRAGYRCISVSRKLVAAVVLVG